MPVEFAIKENAALPPEQIIDEMLSQARLLTGTKNFNDDITSVRMQVE